MTDSLDRLSRAASRANDMVIGASFGIMEARTESERAQARYFQSLFSGVRDVLGNARDGYWEPSGAPEAWESFDSSQAALRLADAVLGEVSS